MGDIYKVVLSNGTEIGNLRLNGNNFISSRPIDAAIFDGAMAPVTIFKNAVPEVHEHMDLVQVTQMGAEYWFILRDVSHKELDEIKLRADIDFLAMMSGVEL